MNKLVLYIILYVFVGEHTAESHEGSDVNVANMTKGKMPHF